MTTFTSEDRIVAEKDGSFTVNVEPIPFAGLVDIEIKQGTTEWLLERLGHVTASKITDVLAKSKTNGEAKTREAYRWELITQRLTGQIVDGFKSSAMEWGTQTEPEARIHYEASNGVFVEQVGFIRHPTIKWVGASLTGLLETMVVLKLNARIPQLIYKQSSREYHPQSITDKCKWVCG